MPTFNLRNLLVVMMTLSFTANRITLDAAGGSADHDAISLIARIPADGDSKGLLPPLEVPSIVDAGPSPSDFVPPRNRFGSESKDAPAEESKERFDSKRIDSAASAAMNAPVTDLHDDEDPSQSSESDETTEAESSNSETTETPGCVTQDEVWQVYTRHLPSCCPDPEVQVFQHECNSWQTRTLDQLLAPFDGILVVFVHGNRMEQCNTLNRGQLYFRCLTAGDGPKVRFVIWSWPSDKIKGQIRDVRVKACRADLEGGYLAWFLNQLDEQQTVSLIGYSYGARTICSAMHLRAFGGNATFPLRPATSTMRIIMNAPAMASCDLSSRGRYRGLMTQVDRMLVLYNSKDPILKRYGVVEKGSRPNALGYTGLTCAIPGGNKIRQINAAPVVGRSHYEPKYLHHGPFLYEMRRCLLWEPMP